MSWTQYLRYLHVFYFRALRICEYQRIAILKIIAYLLVLLRERVARKFIATNTFSYTNKCRPRWRSKVETFIHRVVCVYEREFFNAIYKSGPKQPPPLRPSHSAIAL